MTRHTQRKLSKVCSEEAYQWLQDWICKQNPSFPYQMNPMQYFYTNTAHREYLSKWLEAVIVKILRSLGADPIKAPDKGTYRDNSKVVTDVVGFQRKVGSGQWTKNKNVRPGRADIKCYFNSKMHNLEIKVGKDRMSEAQKREQQRAEANGEVYMIIKTIDDFLTLIR